MARDRRSSWTERPRAVFTAAAAMVALLGVTGGAAASPPPSEPADAAADHGSHPAANDPQDWVAVDENAIPDPMPSVATARIGPSISDPEYLDGIGAFRINCTYSHLSFDDPLVYPGQPGAAHLHVFFGNDGVDAFSTAESIAGSGGTTCTGGTANRSSYWAPAVIDTATGAPVVPTDENALQAYYKTGYRGVPSDAVVDFPAGLRMIAGNSAGTTPGDMSSTWFTCVGTHPDDGQPSFPDCQPGDLFVMHVQFPQCWDGVNLDSPDHRSHMAYAHNDNPGGCPASHPVPLPEVTQNFRFLVPASGMSTWRLASDMYEGPPGYSAHADWWNGWDADVFQRVIDNCYATGLDCKMNNLGDGERLE